jgi:hypothetical protein
MGITPSIAECDGDYHHDSRKNLLLWNLPIIDKANKQGAMEFSVPSSIPGDFFPVEVTFTSKSLYADLKLMFVSMVEDETTIKYSTDILMFADKYEIV